MLILRMIIFVFALTLLSLFNSQIVEAQWGGPTLQQQQQQVNKAYKVDQSGRKPDRNLKYRQSGVPVLDFTQLPAVDGIRVIPRIDVGEENKLKTQTVEVTLPSKKELHIFQPAKIQSPAMVVLPQLNKIAVSPEAKKIKSLEQQIMIPAVPALAYVPEPVIQESSPELVKLIEINQDEYKMLQALIFLEYRKKYDLAMALFVELMDVPQFKHQATYHYAETALGLKLYSEFRQKMLLVSQQAKDPILKKMAIEKLVANVSLLELSDIGLIDPIANELEVETQKYPAYLLRKAKYYSEKGQLAEFEDALMYIPNTAPEYFEATLLRGVFNYRRGQLDLAILDLEGLWPQIKNKKTDQVRNLTALTLARLYFQKGDYQQAYKNYLNVDKSSGQWLTSMVEQAWTQVLAGDYEGAAGNMFSLHTDFFKKAYAPDTYIVRTVGYLNLCQYGDGVHVLDDLNTKYKMIYDQLQNFMKTNSESIKYYDLVKNFLKNTSQEQVNGIPRAFIVELARHPNYIKIQKQINNYEDENSKFNKITIDLIRKEKEARLAMLKAKNDLASSQRENIKPEKKSELEQIYMAKGVEALIYSRGRESIKKMRLAALDRLEKEKDDLRSKAGLNLKQRFTDFTASLDHLIDQKEVLSYEIYSGAGEHIRYQASGGEINAQSSAPIAPEDKDGYKWKFKGEVWEDEIGHYRSSLKNVCPKDDKDDLAQQGS